MNFKKILCSLVSAGVLFGSLGSTAGAVPMKNILGKDLFTYYNSGVDERILAHQPKPVVDSRIVAHIVKLQEFMGEEEARLRLEGKDTLENAKRTDSLVFGIFCCSCYKKKLKKYIKNVVSWRYPAERREDMDVIEYILPENPVQSKELYERFDIGEMSREELAELAAFIRICVPKKNPSTGGVRRKPGRELRREMKKGLEDHRNGYDEVDY